ncbi:MAG: glycosyltransferase, partial [Verrucomicrobiota bacterium]
MIRFIHFTNTFAPLVGGIERSVAEFTAELTRRGHFGRIVAPAFREATESRDGVLRVPSVKGIGEKGFSIRLPVPNLIFHWMEAIEPQVVHAHQPFMLGDTAWRIARRRHIPLVFTHHTLYERYSNWPVIDQKQAKRLLLDLTTQYANRVDLCLAPTGSVASLMRERGIRTPIEVLPTGIRVADFARGRGDRGRAALGLPAGAPVIGHLGRLTAAKNISLLVEAAVRVLQAEPRAWFLLAGEGEVLKSSLETFAAGGVRDRVVHAGVLQGEQLADAYAAMDLFLFTSKTDTQGLVLAESMAAGTPLLALDAPGARDCIEDGRSGVFLPGESDAAAVAEAALVLVRDEARRATLA